MARKMVLWLVLVLVLSAGSVYGDTASSAPLVRITLLNQDPNPARAGDTVSLRFKIENLGGSVAKNVSVELLQDYPFTVVSGPARQYLDNLVADQTGQNYVILEYTVRIDKDVVQGQKELRLKYAYGGYGNEAGITRTFNVNIVTNEFAQIIYVDKGKLDPGKETNLTFTILNVGNAPLQNVIFTWNEPKGAILPVYSSDTKYVKYLDVDQSVDLTYTVIADVNANPGLYQLDLTLNAESLTNATTSVITTKAGVFVGGETDFDVAFSESSAGTTSLSIANIGNNPAQSVSVIIPQQRNFRVSGSTSAIIGNLDKGDYTLVSFQIVSMSASNFSGTGQQMSRQPATQGPRNQSTNVTFRFNGTATNDNPNNLDVVIEYTDTTGKRQTVSKSVPIQFRSVATSETTGAGRQSQQNKGFVGGTVFWILIVLAAAMVAIGGFLFFRKKAGMEKTHGLSFGKRK